MHFEHASRTNIQRTRTSERTREREASWPAQHSISLDLLAKFHRRSRRYCSEIENKNEEKKIPRNIITKDKLSTCNRTT